MKEIFFKTNIGVYTVTTDRQNRERFNLDTDKTGKRVKALFKKNQIKEVKSCWGSYGYYFSLKQVWDYSSPRKQFRIYFNNENKRNVFVQSDLNGEVDIKKLIVKATEYFADEQAYEDKRKKEQEKDKDNDKYIEKTNKKLKGTGFKVDLKYGGFKLESDVNISNQEEMDIFISEAILK